MPEVTLQKKEYEEYRIKEESDKEAEEIIARIHKIQESKNAIVFDASNSPSHSLLLSSLTPTTCSFLASNQPPRLRRRLST